MNSTQPATSSHLGEVLANQAPCRQNELQQMAIRRAQVWGRVAGIRSICTR